MKLPFVLFTLYTVILTNGILADFKMLNSSSSVLYSRKPVKIYQEAIINTLAEIRVTACVLSCQTSPLCFQAAIGENRDCMHLKEIKSSMSNRNGKEVEVEILEDMSPGTLCLHSGISYVESKSLQNAISA